MSYLLCMVLVQLTEMMMETLTQELILGWKWLCQPKAVYFYFCKYYDPWEYLSIYVCIYI